MNTVKRTLRAAAVGMILMAGSGAAWAAEFSLSVNTALQPQDPLFKGLNAFKENVEKRSEGKISVRLFPGSQLGKDEDVLEQARAGAGVAVVVDGGRLAVYTKEFGVLGAPYLASGYDGVRKVVTSPMFETWVGNLRKAAGLQVLSFNWWQGERHLVTNVPVKVPADLAGIRMRTPGAPVWMETIRAMGATPTPMGWAEVYTAMQQKVIDALEAQSPAVYNSKLFEVAKYLTKSGHINLITGVVTSAAWFDGLPADLQKIVREEALKAGDIASRGTEASLADYEKQMAEKGMVVTEIDVTPFREATKSVYEKLGYGELHAELDKFLTN
ncbi:MAG: C4-dicarboxylate TRAP transporter substrate-binding protein [Thalassobaculum sp.]|uniref:C4-dicarboxylate TRAP transporter substrate-binding protein n=1 Tax=Thalassobaculum sp. TaxID=2022740 RepID=UPI0032EAF80B